jgi:PAS domain S-box-containing protein
VIPKVKALEHLSITAKIATSVSLLVALAVAVSLVGLYGLKRMQKAVDTAGQASEVLVSANNVTERVEHFIASHDKNSLLKAKAIMADTLDQITVLALTRPDEAISLTTGLHRFSEAIDTLGMATDIMNTETSNMTTNHGRLQKVAMEIEQNIEERRDRLNKQTAIFDVRLRIIQDAYRILQSIRDGGRKATAIVARGLADGKEADFTEADNTCKALLPVLDMLDSLIDATAWPEGLNRLKTSVTQAGLAVGELIDAPLSRRLTLGKQALQQIEIINEMVSSLEGMVRTKEDNIARATDDLRTDTGLLQNSDNISKRFAERVSKLEAQTLSFRLLPTDEAAGLVIDILDQLTRFARILPSAGSPKGSASALTVGDQIDGYRAAFDRFHQASKTLRQAHDQVRQEADRTASLVTKYANEQRLVAADNRERGALITVLTSVIAVLIAIFIAWHTSNLIARPIVALAAVMRRLADGHLEDEIVGLQRGDELGSMTRAVKVFQDNAIRVRALEAEAEAERQRVLAQLESMVIERTHELQQANTMLHEEIIKHTRAEEEIRRLNEELEQKVEERTRQIRRLVESNIIGIFFWTLEGGVTEVNDAFLSIVGYSRQDLLEGKIRWTDMTPAEWRDADERAREELLARGSVPAFEKEYIRKDGSRVPVLVGAALFEGVTKQGVAFILDISGRKRAELDIRKLNAELMEKISQLNEAQEELVRKEKLSILGQLSGVVGHELRNPLGVMNNAVYFLKMVLTEADETTKEYLDIIASEITNSQRIISDLLDFARTKNPQTQSVALRELVRQTLGRCAIPEKVTVTLDLPESLPKLRIDPNQIGQVLVNLLTNAIQAMPKGGAIQVSARTTTCSGSQENCVAIAVTDTGEGISPENRRKLFQPLFTTKVKGIGLGLVACKNLVEANNGRIDVESGLGKGTTFTLTLPVYGDET